MPRRVGPSDQRTAAGFVGADLSCVRPARDGYGRAIRHRTVAGTSWAGSARIILSFAGRTQEGSAPTQLLAPRLSDGLLRIGPPRGPRMLGVFCARCFNPNPRFLK